jgi:hypothetical protein
MNTWFGQLMQIFHEIDRFFFLLNRDFRLLRVFDDSERRMDKKTLENKIIFSPIHVDIYISCVFLCIHYSLACLFLYCFIN